MGIAHKCSSCSGTGMIGAASCEICKGTGTVKNVDPSAIDAVMGELSAQSAAGKVVKTRSLKLTASGRRSKAGLSFAKR